MSLLDATSCSVCTFGVCVPSKTRLREVRPSLNIRLKCSDFCDCLNTVTGVRDEATCHGVRRVKADVQLVLADARLRGPLKTC